MVEIVVYFLLLKQGVGVKRGVGGGGERFKRELNGLKEQNCINLFVIGVKIHFC